MELEENVHENVMIFVKRDVEIFFYELKKFDLSGFSPYYRNLLENGTSYRHDTREHKIRKNV